MNVFSPASCKPVFLLAALLSAMPQANAQDSDISFPWHVRYIAGSSFGDFSESRQQTLGLDYFDRLHITVQQRDTTFRFSDKSQTDQEEKGISLLTHMYSDEMSGKIGFAIRQLNMVDENMVDENNAENQIHSVGMNIASFNQKLHAGFDISRSHYDDTGDIQQFDFNFGLAPNSRHWWGYRLQRIDPAYSNALLQARLPQLSHRLLWRYSAERAGWRPDSLSLGLQFGERLHAYEPEINVAYSQGAVQEQEMFTRLAWKTGSHSQLSLTTGDAIYRDNTLSSFHDHYSNLQLELHW